MSLQQNRRPWGEAPYNSKREQGMTTPIKAVYEDGVLKPKAPLLLEEHSEVELLVLRPAARDADDRTGWKAIDSLIGIASGAPVDASEKHDDALYTDPRE